MPDPRPWPCRSPSPWGRTPQEPVRVFHRRLLLGRARIESILLHSECQSGSIKNDEVWLDMLRLGNSLSHIHGARRGFGSRGSGRIRFRPCDFRAGCVRGGGKPSQVGAVRPRFRASRTFPLHGEWARGQTASGPYAQGMRCREVPRYSAASVSVMLAAAVLPAPMARMTVAAPVTMSPPAQMRGLEVRPFSSVTM